MTDIVRKIILDKSITSESELFRKLDEALVTFNAKEQAKVEKREAAREAAREAEAEAESPIESPHEYKPMELSGSLFLIDIIETNNINAVRWFIMNGLFNKEYLHRFELNQIIENNQNELLELVIRNISQQSDYRRLVANTMTREAIRVGNTQALDLLLKYDLFNIDLSIINTSFVNLVSLKWLMYNQPHLINQETTRYGLRLAATYGKIEVLEWCLEQGYLIEFHEDTFIDVALNKHDNILRWCMSKFSNVKNIVDICQKYNRLGF